MKKYALLLTVLLFLLLCLPVQARHIHPHASCVSNGLTQQSGPIYGLYFCQTIDDVHIVYLNHAVTDVTDEYFGLAYTDAATAGCLLYVQTLVLVRYRQGVGSDWIVDCYSDPNNYVSIPGVEFGQGVIDAAVARAQQIVYGAANERQCHGYLLPNSVAEGTRKWSISPISYCSPHCQFLCRR